MEKTNQLRTDTISKQRYLGYKGFIVFIAFLGAFVPLSTDAYLPALPQMVAQLNTTAAMINLTLVLFFLFYSGDLLVTNTEGSLYC